MGWVIYRETYLSNTNNIKANTYNMYNMETKSSNRNKREGKKCEALTTILKHNYHTEIFR